MPSSKWTADAARAWYDKLPWLVGCNYVPRTAASQLEMWQAFDAATIDQELGWAAAAGLNTLRVFLHDLAWSTDAAGFVAKVDQFLSIADRHGMGTMLVFLDSCWHPFPRPGWLPEPEPGVHNSAWVQCPGVAVLREADRFDAVVEPYVSGIVKRFGGDPRVIAWDVWNEPDNANAASRGPRDLGEQKGRIAAELLPRVFGWARAAGPSQPITSGIWDGDWSSDATFKPHERVQIEQSDVVSFHNYGPPDQVAAKVAQLQRYDRPLLCTEYMARGVGSTFAGTLPVLKEHRVAAYHWGLVAGRSQAMMPWDSWQKPCETAEPPVWFHDVFRPDGSPYRADEVALLRRLTGRGT